MDHVIASAGLRLTYLRDPTSIAKLDAQKILDDLCEPETRYPLCAWFARVSLVDFDHVVLATDCDTGRHVAMLAANDGDILSGPYLDLRAAFVVDAMRGTKLIHRLIAYTISRISCLGPMPRVIATQTSISACYSLLSLFAEMIPGASVFPEPEVAAIDLRRAGLARQIAKHAAPHLEYEAATGTIRGARLNNPTCFARTIGVEPSVHAMFDSNLGSGDQMMVVIDMRGCDEEAIDTEIRAMIRSRWKFPFLTMRNTSSVADARVNRKPTLTA
jgi:hypothetical protein